MGGHAKCLRLMTGGGEGGQKSQKHAYVIHGCSPSKPDYRQKLYIVSQWHKCLVLLQVPKCFGLVQIFCARPKIYLHIVAVTNILCQTKRWFAFSKIGFCAGTKVFEEALNAVKFLGWLKKFGPAQNILGPVKGQGIRLSKFKIFSDNPAFLKGPQISQKL